MILYLAVSLNFLISCLLFSWFFFPPRAICIMATLFSPLQSFYLVLYIFLSALARMSNHIVNDSSDRGKLSLISDLKVSAFKFYPLM